jgi:5'-nucleotidase
MKQRIALDMDGVMADITEQFLRYDEQDFRRRKTWDEIKGQPERDVFPNIRKYLFMKDFFRTAPVMEGSVEVVKKLNEQYELFIVSAAMEFPQSLPEKQDWLTEHFPFIGWKQIVFCGLKTIVRADIMIDDHFKNLDNFENKTILFSQSHNVAQDAGRHVRVASWSEIERVLLK